jgi:hypothetical protein
MLPQANIGGRFWREAMRLRTAARVAAVHSPDIYRIRALYDTEQIGLPAPVTLEGELDLLR